MASLINAFRNIISDKMWIIKIAIFTFPIYYILSEDIVDSLFTSNLPIGVALVLFYMGIVTIMMNRNINNKEPILPGLFDIPLAIFRSFGAAIIVLPGGAVLLWALNFIAQNFSFEEDFVSYLVHIGVCAFVAPFIVIPAVLYSVNGKITDALRLGKLLEGAGNFIVEFLSFVIQYVLIIYLLAFLVGSVFKEVFGPQSLPSLILTSVVIVLSFLLLFSFASDLYEDVIPAIKSKRNVL